MLTNCVCIVNCVCLAVVKEKIDDIQNIKSEGSVTSPSEVVNEKMVTDLSSTVVQHQGLNLEQIKKDGDQECVDQEQNNVMQDQLVEQKQSSENKIDQELHSSQDQLSEQTQDLPNQDLKQLDQQSSQDQGDSSKPVEGHEQSTSQSQVQQKPPDDIVQQIVIDEQESSNVVLTSEPQTPVKSKPLSNALVPMTWPKVQYLFVCQLILRVNLYLVVQFKIV